MSLLDPSSTSFEGPVSNISAAYLVSCWKDGCAARVDPDDDLGLCATHRLALRQMPMN